MPSLQPPAFRPGRYRLGSASRRCESALLIVAVAGLFSSFVLFVGEVIVTSGGSRLHCFAATKNDIARATTMKYAFEAFPSWLADHPGRGCPAKFEELNAYMNNKDLRDPWGNDYRFFCAPTDPANLLVWSAGEDEKPNTSDDVWSVR